MKLNPLVPESAVSDSSEHENSLTPTRPGHDANDDDAPERLPKDVEPLVLDGYQLFENTSNFSAAIVIPSRWFPFIRWSESNEFACAVIIGLDDPFMIISAYLPQPGLGLDIYQRALAAVLSLARSHPRHLNVKHIFIGTDANCNLCKHDDVNHIIGDWTMLSPTNRGCAARSQAFLDLALELQLKAANTFHPESQSSDCPACWTHRWKRNPNVLSQIDFVLCPVEVDTTVQLLRNLDCCSDHVPILLEAELPLGRKAPIPRRARSLKGWRPANDHAASLYSELLNSLPEGADVSTIQHHVSSSSKDVPFTNFAQRAPRFVSKEPPEVEQARLQLAQASSLEDRHRGARFVQSQKKMAPLSGQ